jgi:hypothetical protein
MTRLVSIVLFGALALAGCSSATTTSPSASPASSAQVECERNGGAWRAALGFCEYEAPRWPR